MVLGLSLFFWDGIHMRCFFFFFNFQIFRSLLVICFMPSGLYMSIPTSQCILHPTILHIHMFVLYVCLCFCFANKFICIIFLHPTYKQCYMICVFLCLTYSVWVSRSVHISANGTVLFLLWLSNIPLYICITSSLFIPLSLSFFLPSSFLLLSLLHHLHVLFFTEELIYVVTKTLYARQKKRHRCIETFWTLWEKASMGWSERTASKHVYDQVWNRSPAQVGCMRQVLRAGALGRPRGMGWGFRMGNTCKSMADSCQCMAKTTTIL